MARAVGIGHQDFGAVIRVHSDGRRIGGICREGLLS